MKNLFLITVVGVLGLFVIAGYACAAHVDGPYEGRIIDAETGEPIEGVVVQGTWYIVHHTAAGPKHEYYDAQETVTDKNGEFKIQGMGLRVFSNLEPVRVLIFKAGYDYEKGPWTALKKYAKHIKWEGDRAIVPLKKLTMEERKKHGSPPDPPSEAPIEKVILMLKEIDKDRVERGLDPRGIWRGERYE